MRWPDARLMPSYLCSKSLNTGTESATCPPEQACALSEPERGWHTSPNRPSKKGLAKGSARLDITRPSVAVVSAGVHCGSDRCTCGVRGLDPLVRVSPLRQGLDPIRYLYACLCTIPILGRLQARTGRASEQRRGQVVRSLPAVVRTHAYAPAAALGLSGLTSA